MNRLFSMLETQVDEQWVVRRDVDSFLKRTAPEPHGFYTICRRQIASRRKAELQWPHLFKTLVIVEFPIHSGRRNCHEGLASTVFQNARKGHPASSNRVEIRSSFSSAFIKMFRPQNELGVQGDEMSSIRFASHPPESQVFHTCTLWVNVSSATQISKQERSLLPKRITALYSTAQSSYR
jgi:hypothetical protein